VLPPSMQMAYPTPQAVDHERGSRFGLLRRCRHQLGGTDGQSRCLELLRKPRVTADVADHDPLKRRRYSAAPSSSLPSINEPSLVLPSPPARVSTMPSAARKYWFFERFFLSIDCNSSPAPEA
jgi:hypothetical protein